MIQWAYIYGGWENLIDLIITILLALLCPIILI